MDGYEIIDLCAVKSENSDDTSTTIPLDEAANTTATSNNHSDINLLLKVPDNERTVKTFYTEQWIREQNDAVSFMNKLMENNNPEASISAPMMDMADIIPVEITELVSKECAIKLINYLVIYAINKVTEADLRRKLISVIPDIDPQINYRSNIGFQCVYERCVVLFYEALLDLIEIIQLFESELQNVVVLWMYDTVENICKAHSVNGEFLRNEKYIEVLLRDFLICQNKTPAPGNIFFNIYQKMQPTVHTVASDIKSKPIDSGPHTKKQRKSRIK